MSADNGIYIAKFPDGYRVAYAMAIENIEYYPKGSKERKEALKDYFGGSEVYVNEDEAILAGHNLAKEYHYLEYGVSCIPGELEAFE